MLMNQPFASPLSPQIDELWERRAELSPADADARDVVIAAVDQLDTGAARVAFVDPATDTVVVDERAKRAILLSFRVLDMARSQVGDFQHHDRVPLKKNFEGVRVVPGAIARWGSYLAPGVVLMPSYTNIGGYVDSGSMVDTWATVGSCAQIGRNVHLAGGAGIGGVLEPPNAVPVVVEDWGVSTDLPWRCRGVRGCGNPYGMISFRPGICSTSIEELTLVGAPFGSRQSSLWGDFDQ